MNNRCKKAAYYNGLHKAAGDNSAQDITVGALAAALALVSTGGTLAGAAMSTMTSPTDIDMDNARKEYQSSALDAAINELGTKLQNERASAPTAPGTATMRRAMRLI